MTTGAIEVRSADGPLKCLKTAVNDGKELFKTFDITKSSTLVPYQWEVAVVCDAMTEKEVKEDIEQNTHIMVAGFLRDLAKIESLTWDKVLTSLTTSPVVAPDTGFDKLATDRYAKKGDKSKFLEDGKPIPALLDDIKSWMTRTIGDRQVIQDLQLDVEMLGEIVTTASKGIDFMSNVMDEADYQERTIVEVGVLRFPDEDDEYFKLYKVTLKAFIDTSREMFTMVDKNGLYLEYEARRFIPRENIIEKISDEIKDKAVAESVKMYTSKPKEKKSIKHVDDKNWPPVVTAGGILPTVVSVVKNATTALNAFDMKEDGSCPLDCKMAVAFDNVSEESVARMSKNTMIMISGINRKLKAMTSPTFDSVQSTLAQVSIVSPMGSDMRSDFINKSYVDGKFPKEDTQDSLKVEIKQWFKRLIRDSEVMEDLQKLVDMKVMVDVLVKAGKHMDTLDKIKGDNVYSKRKMVDLTVLRFPDENREYFHLYTIQLSAFTDCKHEQFDEIDQLGLTGEYSCIKFEPRDLVIERLSAKTSDRVAAETMTFFTAQK